MIDADPERVGLRIRAPSPESRVGILGRCLRPPNRVRAPPPARTSPTRSAATSPSSPTSTTARRRWSTRCCTRAAPSASNERVAERAMDNTDLERERGITILAKNTAVHYKRPPDQHRRHAGPRRLRRRGRADAVDGRRRDAARRRVGRAAAADALRAAQGARAPAAADRRHQQDRPARRAPAGSAERDLRPVHRSRRDRGAARFPGALHQRAGSAPRAATRTRRARICGRCSTRSSSTCRRRAATPTRRCSCSSPTSTRATTSAASRSAASSTAACKIGDPVAVVQARRGRPADEGHQAVRVRRPEARRHPGGRRRRHRLPRRHRGHHDRRDDRRRRAPDRRSRRSRSTSRPCR